MTDPTSPLLGGFISAIAQVVVNHRFDADFAAIDLADAWCVTDDPRVDDLLAYQDALGDPKTVTREVLMWEFGLLQDRWGVPRLTNTELTVLLLITALRRGQADAESRHSLAVMWVAMGVDPSLVHGLEPQLYWGTLSDEGDDMAEAARADFTNWLLTEVADRHRARVLSYPMPSWVDEWGVRAALCA